MVCSHDFVKNLNLFVGQYPVFSTEICFNNSQLIQSSYGWTLDPIPFLNLHYSCSQCNDSSYNCSYSQATVGLIPPNSCLKARIVKGLMMTFNETKDTNWSGWSWGSVCAEASNCNSAHLFTIVSISPDYAPILLGWLSDPLQQSFYAQKMEDNALKNGITAFTISNLQQSAKCIN